MIQFIQDVLKKYIPSLDVNPGSAVYNLIILPMSYIYEEIKALIDSIDLSPKPENFGVEEITEKKYTGFIVVTSTLSKLLEGAILYTEDNKQLVVTADSLTNTLIPVSANENHKVNKVVYADYISSGYVHTEISGGREGENYWDTIREKLAGNWLTKQGIINVIKNQFPQVIDVKFTNKILVKCPIQIISTQQTTINDVLFKVAYTNEKLLSITSKFKYTKDEYNLLTFQRQPETIQYYSPAYFKDIYTYITSHPDIPIGWSPIIEHAPFVRITINSTITNEFSNYVNNLKIGILDIWELKKKLPYKTKVYLNDVEYSENYTIPSAYYCY